MRGINYEKKIFIFVTVSCVFSIFSGCCTCGRIKADDTDIIAGNSYATGQLEATITALDGTVNDSRLRIANVIETSRGIAGGIERVEYLFGQYESEVERILKEIERIRKEIETPGETDNNSDGDTDSFCDNSDNSIGAKN